MLSSLVSSREKLREPRATSDTTGGGIGRGSCRLPCPITTLETTLTLHKKSSVHQRRFRTVEKWEMEKGEDARKKKNKKKVKKGLTDGGEMNKKASGLWFLIQITAPPRSSS